MNADTDTQIVQHAVHAAKDTAWRRRIWIFAAILALSLAVGTLSIITLYVGGQRYQQQQSTAADAAQQLASQVRGLGATPVVQPPVPLTPVPGPAGKQGQPGQPGPGASQQEIDAAVEGYFAAHPPGATPAMVAVQVASYLTANPPKPGPPPTTSQITTAASDYIAGHAADFQGAAGSNGSNGQDGQPGANATDDQVTAAVAAYCDAHQQCQGQQGIQGDTGISITDLEFVRDSTGDCQSVATLHDPATGQDTTVSHPAGDAACPPATPATTTTPPTNGLLHIGGN